MHRKPIHQCFSPLIQEGCPSCTYPVLVPVSRDYPGLRGQVAYVLLTRSPLGSPASWIPSFDLHVLGTPPAFILSQDQTLHLFLARSISIYGVFSINFDVLLLNSCLVFKDRNCPEAHRFPVSALLDYYHRNPLSTTFSIIFLFIFTALNGSISNKISGLFFSVSVRLIHR